MRTRTISSLYQLFIGNDAEFGEKYSKSQRREGPGGQVTTSGWLLYEDRAAQSCFDGGQ
jgi:hypothetical protein